MLGFSVWAHHMFVAGMADWLRVPMMITTLLIAIPTGIKVFSWIATLWRGRIHLTTPMLFALGFVTMFVIGGLSGIYLGSVPIDIAASDTYFIVAHIHYVLFGGSVFTIYAGVYYWFPKMTGRMYDERLGKWHFWLTFVSFNATFFPMHYIGLRGMPRRVSDYDAAFGDLNLFISIASFVLGASFVVFVYNMITSWVARPRRRGEPVARAHARVAGLVAAADLQLRRDPAGRRRAVRVRRARRAARDPQPGEGGAGGAGGARMSRAISVLVVANETLVGDELVDTLRRRAEHGPVRVAVVAPVTQPREGYVVYRDSRRAAAARRLDRVLACLRLAGIPAHGGVFDDEPLAAVKDVLASEEIDEIVVCTHPGDEVRVASQEPRSTRSAGPQATARSSTSSPTSAGAPAPTSSSSRTRPCSASRCSTGSAPRAEEGPASFLIVCPQSDPSRGEHPEAERRLRAALSMLRSEGLDVHGQIAHPDPFVAAMEAVEDERTDEIIVSTFPGERSGWLRRDLVGSLRAQTGLPVQHVVVEDLVGGGRMSAHAEPLHAATTSTTARPPRIRARASTRGRSGCCCSSARRSCCSARSSRPTSSSASSIPSASRRSGRLTPVRVPGVRRRGQHVHPRDLELHDALGAPVDQARAASGVPRRGWS